MRANAPSNAAHSFPEENNIAVVAPLEEESLVQEGSLGVQDLDGGLGHLDRTWSNGIELGDEIGGMHYNGETLADMLETVGLNILF